VIARVAVVIVALAAIAWLGTGLHAVDLEQHGMAIGGRLAKRLSLSEALAAGRFYERARRFDPDTQPLLLEAGALRFFKEESAKALGLAREVTRREPENVSAWALVAILADRLDPRLAARARRRAGELSPPVPPPR
jgi:Flp pilus assembly protein TadD